MLTRLSDDTAQSGGVVGSAYLPAYSSPHCASTKKHTIAHHSQGYVCFLSSCEKKRCFGVHLIHALRLLCRPAHSGGTSSTSWTNNSKTQPFWRGSSLGLQRALVAALWVFFCTNPSSISFLPFKGISHPPRLVRRAPSGFQRPARTQQRATPLQKRRYLMARTTTPAVTGAIYGQTINGGRAAVACSTSSRDLSSVSGMQKPRFVSTVD